jgi:cation diffusion facilitator CzcD-associated flavoprotein CzcO/acetyl esterase/lipase
VSHGPTDPGRALLYLHGGGFSTGSPRSYRALAAALSRATGSTVYLPDYRLAPAHPYPAALTDTLAAYRALLAAGLPASQVVLAGDSAGGHLALAAALRLRAEGAPLPAGLALLSPWLELSRPPGAGAGSRDPLLGEAWLRSCARAYLASADPAGPGVTPLAADLAGLPPLHVQAGAEELLVGDADRLVARARAAGVPVGYDRWPGMWHDFQVFTGLLAAADEAVAALGRAIQPWWPDAEPADGVAAPAVGSAAGSAATADAPPATNPGATDRAGGADATNPGATNPGGTGGARPAGRRREPTVLIVGAGFGGLGMAIELTKRGHRNFVVLEKAGRIGGVWRENSYPGAACDVPSLQYCYSFEQRPDWPRRFSGQAEIVAYLQHCVARYGLAGHLRLGTEVVAADYTDYTDGTGGRWAVRTGTGEVLTADVLVFACGQLSRPSYPDIPGLDRFAGRMFHSACWDHDHDLAGRRVAVIGTGSSALQFVPEIAPTAGRLTVFQRTAGWVVPKLDRPYSTRAQARHRRWPATMTAARHGWDLFEELLTFGLTRHRSALTPLRLVSRAMLGRQVHDPQVRRQLTPTIEFGCKRIGFSNDWYPTFNRPTVELVTAPIEAVTEAGVRTADGRLTEVDTIILGTGFASTEFLAPIGVRGAGGQQLAAVWRDGARAYLGITVPGFPNMFLLYGPNTNLGSGSVVHMLESQARYVGSAVDLLAAGLARSLEVRSDVADGYDRWTQQRLSRTAWVSCQNWYRTATGRVTNNWPGQLREYRRRTDHLELVDYRAATDRSRQPDPAR